MFTPDEHRPDASHGSPPHPALLSAEHATASRFPSATQLRHVSHSPSLVELHLLRNLPAGH